MSDTTNAETATCGLCGKPVKGYATIERLAYSTAEAAEALGVTRQHVHNLIVRGELRSVKLGRSRRIPATELHRILGDTQ